MYELTYLLMNEMSKLDLSCDHSKPPNYLNSPCYCPSMICWFEESLITTIGLLVFLRSNTLILSSVSAAKRRESNGSNLIEVT